LIDVQDAAFAQVLADREPAADDGLPGLAPPGRVAEVSEARRAIMAELAGRIAQDGGAALIVDFAGTGDTLQAVRGHRHAERFADPGEADLAAAVDFTALAEAAATQGAHAHGPVAQGTFLRALGIEQRCETLLRRADADQTASLRAALARLVGSDAMGELYGALAVCQPGMPTLAGFEAAP
jgi:SAM-dependent MidA family methyltransferase